MYACFDSVFVYKVVYICMCNYDWFASHFIEPPPDECADSTVKADWQFCKLDVSYVMNHVRNTSTS